jgi:hypothetical protein
VVVLGMPSRKSASISAFVLAAIAVAVSLTGYIVLSIPVPKNVTIMEINWNPQSFNNTYVRVDGYLANTSDYTYGSTYFLRDNGSEIALSQRNGPSGIDLAKYVSFISDGGNHAQTRDMLMSIEGHIRYMGFVTDMPSRCIEVESAQLKSARWDQATLEKQQIRVEVEKTSYSVGEQVRFRLFKKNLSNEPIFAGVFNIGFRISNSRGESILGIGINPLWASDFMVNPGEEIELQGILPPWNQINVKGVQVSLGSYTINVDMDTTEGSVALCLKIVIAIK